MVDRETAWAEFWIAVEEVNREIAAREARQKEIPKERCVNADQELAKCERAMRELRARARALPGVFEDLGCKWELAQYRTAVKQVSAAWRDLKREWRRHTPYPPIGEDA